VTALDDSWCVLYRSLHHALLSKRIQVLREKLTELDRKKQELRIDSGRDSHTKELLQTSKETLQKSVDELCKRLQSIEEERETLNGDEDRNTEAELKQKGRVEHVLQATEKNNKEIKAKTASLVELEATIAKLEVFQSFVIFVFSGGEVLSAETGAHHSRRMLLAFCTHFSDVYEPLSDGPVLMWCIEDTGFCAENRAQDPTAQGTTGQDAPGVPCCRPRKSKSAGHALKKRV